MPLRMVKKDRSEQAKQQTQAMATPAPGILGAGSRRVNFKVSFKGSKKAEEPKSPSERRDERKAQQRETRIKLKEYGMKKGGLKGNQKKLDKNNNNRIDAQDFKILKAEKAKGRGMGLQDEKVQPGKVMKANLGILAMKKAKDKGAKGAEFLSPLALAKRMFNKKAGGVMKAKDGKLGEAKDYKKYLKGLKEATKSKSAQRAGRAAMKAAKSTTIGKVALGVAGAGMAAKKFIESDKFKNILKKKMNKKMGGGMMKYNRGGGADTGAMGEAKSKLSTAIDAFERRRKKEKLQAPKRGPMKPAKAMGGGMIGGSQMPGYKTGTSVKARGCKLGRSKPTKMY